MTACGEAAADPVQTLASACGQARDDFADAPPPADSGTQQEFVDAADTVAQTVADVLSEVADQIESPSAADMLWQLTNFPIASNTDDMLKIAHHASAGIIRLDRFAQDLGVPDCGAATWRPADWRAMADRLKEDVNETDFMTQVNDLCAETFPDPDALREGASLLEALAARSANGEPEELAGQVLPLLSAIDDRPSNASLFLRDFSDRLPRLAPPESAEPEFIELVAAFIEIDATIPRVTPRNPSEEFQQRASAALTGLQESWEQLGISC